MHQTGVVLSFKESDFVFGDKLSFYIRKTAKKLASSVKDNSREMEDFEQDILTELWEARLKWDPTKGSSWAEYARVVIKNRARKIMVEAKSQKRNHQCTIAIEDVYSEFCEAVNKPLVNTMMMADDSKNSPTEGPEMQITIDRFINTLPDRLRPFAVALQALSVQETAMVLGVSVATVNRRKHNIRARMVKAGLNHLLT